MTRASSPSSRRRPARTSPATGTPASTATAARTTRTRPSLTKAFGFYAKYFTKLIQRLAAVQDIDGSRLLDNTLVLWVSDLGYGSGHYCWNYPVVLAGLKSAFSKGQGRHVVGQVNSLGDLYAQVLRMLGGSDTTFGSTGTLSSAAGSTSFNFFRRWVGRA